MTDAQHETLEEALKRIESKTIEERNTIMQWTTSEIDKVVTGHGRREVLKTIGSFPKLFAIVRSHVEKMQDTEKDDAATAKDLVGKLIRKP